MKILVVSLMRLGDFLMAVPTLNGLKKSLNARVDVLAHKQISHVSNLVDSVDHWHYIDRAQLQDSIGHTDHFIFDALDDLSSQVAQLSGENYDVIINLTQNKFSAYICGAINAKEKLGMIAQDQSEFSFGSPWFEYLNKFSAPQDAFHFVDVFFYGSGLTGVSRDFHLRRTEKGKEEIQEFSGGSKKRVLLQVLTSDAKKNWPLAKWKESISSFVEMNPDYELVILCSPAEREQLESWVEELNEKWTVRLAAVSLEGALSLMDESELLVSGDTSIKHLACSTPIRLLELSIGSSEYRKTGAYSGRAFILQSKERCAPCSHRAPCSQSSHLCAERLSPELVALMMNKMVSGPITDIKVLSREFFAEAAIFRPRISETEFWWTQAYGDEVENWSVGQWFDRQSWKLLLEKKSKIQIGDDHVDVVKMRRAIDHIFNRTSSTTWQNTLAGMEKSAVAFDRRLLEAIKNLEGTVLGEGTSAFNSISEVLSQIHDDNTVSHFLGKDERFSLASLIRRPQGVEKVRALLTELSQKNNIKINLIKTLRHQMKEAK